MKKSRLFSGILAAAMLLTACGANGTESTSADANKDCIYREEELSFYEGEGDVLSFYEGEGDVVQMTVVGDTLYTEVHVYPDYSQIETRDVVTLETETVAETVVAAEKVKVSEEAAEDSETAEESAGDSETAEESAGDAETAEEAEVVVEETAGTGTTMVMNSTSSSTRPGAHGMAVGVDEMKTTRLITSYDFDGNQKNQITLELGMNSSSGTMTADTNGNIYCIEYQYATYEGDDTKDKVYLAAYSNAGEEMWRIYLNEKTGEDEYYYANSLHCVGDNQILVESGLGIECYDMQGNPVKLVENSDTSDRRLLRIRDDKFAYLATNGETSYIQTVDINTGTLGEKISLPFNYYRYQFCNGRAYDTYLTDDYGIYGYNIGDTELTKIMDFIASDFAANYIYQMAVADENTFFGYYYTEEGPVLRKFVKVNPEDIVDKIDLTLGCHYLDSNIKQEVIKFNKNSDTYKIHISDYSIYDTMEDYTQGLTRLNTDIISGNVPDIMILNTQMPVNSYISKGIFVDLNELIAEDTEFKKEDFLPNVFEALSSEDGMYQITPSFNVMTFAAKAADVGEEPGWTMDEALALLESKPEGTKLLGEITADNFLYYSTWICGEEYINWEKGECSFDSEGFIKILEFANTLPRELDYSAVYDDESYWQEMETQYRNGKTIVSMSYLGSFRDHSYLEQGTFGEPITYIGFPSENGIGGSLAFNTNFAISAQSENREAAWEFVKTFFTEEYQDEIEYNFPVRISSLEKREAEAWEKPFYLDENGEKVETEDYFYLNGVDVPIEPLTKEQTAKVKEFIQSLNTVCSYNQDIYNIVVEEAASYFEGQKSAAEAAGIIQSRVKIYVNENR